VIHSDPDDSSALDQLTVLRESVLLYDADTTNPALIQAIHTLHLQLLTLGLGGGDGRGLVLLGRMYPPPVVTSLTRTLAALPTRLAHSCRRR
jgi:hypothetical protein